MNSLNFTEQNINRTDRINRILPDKCYDSDVDRTIVADDSSSDDMVLPQIYDYDSDDTDIYRKHKIKKNNS